MSFGIGRHKPGCPCKVCDDVRNKDSRKTFSYSIRMPESDRELLKTHQKRIKRLIEKELDALR